MPSSDGSSSRPPTGLLRSNNSRFFMGPKCNHQSASKGLTSRIHRSEITNSASMEKNSQTGDDKYNESDDSSCDDTYVSMSSNRNRRNEPRDMLKVETDRILKETTRNTNNSPCSHPSKQPMKNKYFICQSPSNGSISKIDSNSVCDSSGILDKLKNDINSLELLRQSSFSETIAKKIHLEDANQSTTVDGSRFGRSSKNETTGKSSHIAFKPYKSNTSNFSSYVKTKSGDRSCPHDNDKLRDSLTVDTVSKEGRCKKESPKSNISVRDYTDRKTLESKMVEKEKEIEKLQLIIDGLKRESIREKEQREIHSNTLSDMKSKIKEIKAKELETQSGLSEVMNNLKQERQIRTNEIRLMSKLHQSDITLLEEKMKEAHEKREEMHSNIVQSLTEDLSKKNEIIDEYNEVISALRSSLNNVTKSKEDVERTLQSKIARLELRLDEQTAHEIEREAKLNETILATKVEWIKRVKNLELKLNDQAQNEEKQMSEVNDNFRAKEEEWVEKLSQTGKALEALQLSNSDLKRENQQLKMTVESAEIERKKIVDHHDKEMEETKKKEEGLTLQVEDMKTTERERDEYMSKLEKSLAIIDDEKREHNIKLEKLNQALEESKLEHTKTITALKASLEKSKDATLQVQSQLSEALVRFDSSTNEVHNLSRKVTELEKEKSRLKFEVSSMETTLQSERENCISQLSESRSRIEEMTKDTELLNKEINHMKTEVKAYKVQLTKMSEMESKIKELTSSLKNEELKIASKTKEISSLQSELEGVNERLCLSEKKCKDLQKDEIEQSEHLQKFKVNLNKANATIDALTLDLNRSKEESKDRNDQMRSALESLDEMMKYIDKMKVENDEITKSLEVEIIALMKKIEDLEKSKLCDQNTIKVYGEEKDRLLKELEVSYSLRKKEKLELERLESKVIDLDGKHSKEINDVTAKYEVRLKEVELKLQDCSEAARVLQEQGNSQMNNIISRVAETTETHVKEMSTMRDVYETQVKKLEAEISHRTSEVTVLHTKLEEAVKENMKEAGEQSKRIQELQALLKQKSQAFEMLQNSEKKLEMKISELNQKEASLKSCENCALVKGLHDEQEKSCTELQVKLQESFKNELKLRGELAQNKQMMMLMQSNEKLLEQHIKSLESQINTLVSDYETKLQAS